MDYRHCELLSALREVHRLIEADSELSHDDPEIAAYKAATLDLTLRLMSLPSVAETAPKP